MSNHVNYVHIAIVASISCSLIRSHHYQFIDLGSRRSFKGRTKVTSLPSNRLIENFEVLLNVLVGRSKIKKHVD